jgi:hypothetical protein
MIYWPYQEDFTSSVYAFILIDGNEIQPFHQTSYGHATPVHHHTTPHQRKRSGARSLSFTGRISPFLGPQMRCHFRSACHTRTRASPWLINRFSNEEAQQKKVGVLVVGEKKAGKAVRRARNGAWLAVRPVSRSSPRPPPHAARTKPPSSHGLASHQSSLPPRSRTSPVPPVHYSTPRATAASA